MRARLLAPALAAVLALGLAACDEPDAVASDPAQEPVQTSAEIEASDPGSVATAQPVEPTPDAPSAQAQGPAPGEPVGNSAQDMISTPAAPVPSSVFEQGVDALGEIDASGSAVFADAPFEPGAFTSGDIELSLDSDGDFTLVLDDDGDRYTGQARVYGDMMTLSNVDAPPGEGGFPMTCRIAAAPSNGFALHADGTSCALLDGAIFTPAS